MCLLMRSAQVVRVHDIMLCSWSSLFVEVGMMSTIRDSRVSRTLWLPYVVSFFGKCLISITTSAN